MSRPSDRLALLETFVRIARAGSISAAARDLGVSQPTASRQLAELETRLHTTLVRRTTHELSLTEAGEALLDASRDLLSGWDAIEERHLGDASRLAGTLRVVAPVALGQTLLSGLACRFQTEHPDIVLDWELEDRAIRFAATGCDCWIRVGPVPDDTLVVRELATVERIVACSPGYLDGANAPSTPAGLKGLALLALEPFEGRAVPLTGPRGRTVTVRPAVRLTTNNIAALREATLGGLGIAVLPRWFVDAELGRGALVEPLPGWRAPTLPVNVAYAPARYQPRRLRVFVERLVAEAPGLLSRPIDTSKSATG